MLFLGEFDVSFTGQGRVIIPKKIREALGDSKSLVITKGFETCLAGFRPADWEKGAQALITPSILEMDKAEMKRHLFSSAVQLEIDEQGRIVLPKNLLSYAGLYEKDVVIVGVGTHFEIWDHEKWKNYLIKTEPNIKNLVKGE